MHKRVAEGGCITGSVSAAGPSITRRGRRVPRMSTSSSVPATASSFFRYPKAVMGGAGATVRDWRRHVQRECRTKRLLRGVAIATRGCVANDVRGADRVDGLVADAVCVMCVDAHVGKQVLDAARPEQATAARRQPQHSAPHLRHCYLRLEVNQGLASHIVMGLEPNKARHHARFQRAVVLCHVRAQQTEALPR